MLFVRGRKINLSPFLVLPFSGPFLVPFLTGWEFLPDLELIEILDLLHAIAYLWEAAHLFHPKASRAASRWVKKQLQRMLNGRITTVIRSLRWQATRHQLKAKRRDDLERICNYFANNSHRMA